MKHFLIKYRLQNGSQDTWHQDITEFISALDGDPALQGKISYRCMKSGSDYYHLATAMDDQAIKALQARAFFSRYTEKTKLVAGGAVDVLPLEIIAETKRTA
jgi:hypothetical protein